MGVSREIKLGGTPIYEFDAESPVGEHVEDSPTPLAIPGPAGSGLGGGSVPADRHTTHSADSRRAPSDGGYALVAAHRAAQSGFPPPISDTPKPPTGGCAGGSYASPVSATPQKPAPEGAGAHVSLGDGASLLCPSGTAAGVPHRDVSPARSPGERWHPEFTGAGGRPPLDTGRHPPLWESRRLQDLERDLEDAQATCQALSSEQDCRLQELQRVRADLHRSEGELASIRRDHATVSGELVRQRSHTRSLEEEGSRLRRQLADAQRAARDVAGAVDERLSRHLPAILEAVQIVRDEHISQPAVERALRGWVPAGYGPPSTANPNLREMCATLVCAAVLRVDPPPPVPGAALASVAGPSPARCAPPDGGRGTGTPPGVVRGHPPDEQGPNDTQKTRDLPGGPHDRPACRRGHPREPLRGGHHSHCRGCGRYCNPHTGAGRAPRPLGVPQRGAAGLADGGGPEAQSAPGYQAGPPPGVPPKQRARRATSRLWAKRVLGRSGVFARAARHPGYRRTMYWADPGFLRAPRAARCATTRLCANRVLGGSGVFARAAPLPGYGRTGYWVDPGFLRALRDFPVMGEPVMGCIRGFCARRATSRLWAKRVLGGSGVFCARHAPRAARHAGYGRTGYWADPGFCARRATSRLRANRVLGGSGVFARAARHPGYGRTGY